MKLISINIEANLPVLGSLGNQSCDNPGNRVRGWRICVRGPAVFLVSPPGWSPTPQAGERPTTGPITVVEVPRIHCIMRWEGVDAIDGAQKYDGQPMWTDAERKQQEQAELERATAPTPTPAVKK